MHAYHVTLHFYTRLLMYSQKKTLIVLRRSAKSPGLYHMCNLYLITIYIISKAYHIATYYLTSLTLHFLQKLHVIHTDGALFRCYTQY